jgi:hypothetical protein
MQSPGWESLPPLGPVEIESLYDRALATRGSERLAHRDLLCIP